MKIITPNWPAPKNIHAGTSTRIGGVSPAPYDSLNLGQKSGDNIKNVLRNRELFHEQRHLPHHPTFLNQTHSNIAVIAENYDKEQPADAIYTASANKLCTVLTADCLPVLICDTQGTEVAAIHAGWRGLAQGVIETTVAHFKHPHSSLMAWLGPAIGPNVFEVGEEVRDVFIQQHASADSAFTPNKPNHWLANLYLLARLRLQALDIHQIFGGDYCTFSEPTLFFSYRRDGEKTGRMASFIHIS